MSNLGWLPGEDIPKLLSGVVAPVGIEVGTAQGFTTKYLLEMIPDLKLYGIDPYMNYRDWDGLYIEQEQRLIEFLAKVSPFGERYTHIYKMSDNATANFEDGLMDFVFIDGEHTYAQVTSDCKNYWPKVKSGGLLIGHDYTAIREVFRAVNDFAARENLTISQANQDLWYVIKQ